MTDVELIQNISLDIDSNANSEIETDLKNGRIICTDLIGQDILLDVEGSIRDILEVDLSLNGSGKAQAIVHINTKEYWNSHSDLVGEKGHIYVYTNSCYVDNVPIPGIKIGDGLSYLIDNAFVASDHSTLYSHINDSSVHLRPGERYFWNNKVRCDDTTIKGKKIIFTKN